MADRVDPAAHVYAKALHEAAGEAGRVQEVDRDLVALVSTLGESPVVLRALVNPALPGEGKRRILVGLLTGSEPLARNAVLVLLEHSRLPLLVDLQSAYAELAADDEHILPVQVTTAVALDRKELDALEARISAAVGRRAQLTASVDPALIGGLVLRARNVLVDASVKRRLEELRRALIRTPLPVGSEA
jgi:F-type H+-transporting ATPase subunit delta